MDGLRWTPTWDTARFQRTQLEWNKNVLPISTTRSCNNMRLPVCTVPRWNEEQTIQTLVGDAGANTGQAHHAPIMQWTTGFDDRLSRQGRSTAAWQRTNGTKIMQCVRSRAVARSCWALLPSMRVQ